MADMHTPLWAASVPLWAVSVQGPDDLIAAADYLTAVRVANAFNAWWANLRAEQPLREYDPRMWAVPVEWIGDIDRHAEWVANPSPEYAGFFDAPSQEAETVKALRETLLVIEDMIDNCANIPRDPSSIAMMVLEYARTALAGSAS